MATLRQFGVPLNKILSGKVWGRKGLANQVSGKQASHVSNTSMSLDRGIQRAPQANDQQQHEQQQLQQKQVVGNVVDVERAGEQQHIRGQTQCKMHQIETLKCGSGRSVAGGCDCLHRTGVQESREQAFCERMAACQSFPLMDLGPDEVDV